MSDAIAHAIITFGQSTSIVNGPQGQGRLQVAAHRR